MQIAKLLGFQDSGLKAGHAKMILMSKSSQVAAHVLRVLAFYTTACWNYFLPTEFYVVLNNEMFCVNMNF